VVSSSTRHRHPHSFPTRRSSDLSGSRRDEVDMNVLRALADSSGGGAFLLSEGLVGTSSTQMERVLDTVAEELRSQYTLGYYPAQDRKSTRLNSSHEWISYAVFCL